MIFNLFKKSNIKLVVGLGNPGKKYENTRHNVGFLALDFLLSYLCHPELDSGSSYCNTSFQFNRKFNADISEIKQDKIKIIFAKPQTFMNESGQAVQKLASFYKIKPENITVLHDDLDIEFGKIKEAMGRGSAGHNGVKSIIKHLGTKEFKRIRIGIDKSDKIPSDKYVLLPFSKDELSKLNNIFKQIKI